jgi:DNA-binding NtrC family response regulator
VRELRNIRAGAFAMAEDTGVIPRSDLDSPMQTLNTPDAPKDGAPADSHASPTATAPTPNSPFETDMSEVLMLPFAEARALALREFDRFFLSAALERNSGNIARTARSLGLHRQSLQKLMTRRGLKSRRATATAAAAIASNGADTEPKGAREH